ncbi:MULTISPECIES: hypothetical protein [Dyella]|uniref:DUF4148 domain-containing protein n=2 Tax=Dyella TaxID=231454 RepID=A0A4R0YR18_9GAMM|nr:MULTISPECIES: hypothetical protein [Dyella]TBR36615.1 hypothetical protein EYV96_11835 [Dyella terrae]TCI08293.1 hypothetical protein EZM97_27035 [Dyella soli]
MRRIIFLTIPLAAIVAACSSPSTPHPNEPPKPQAEAAAPVNATLGSKEWFEWVDQRLGVSDSQAHGPDYGSVEWNNAVQRRLGQEAPQLRPGTPEWQQAVDALLRTRATPAS